MLKYRITLHHLARCMTASLTLHLDEPALGALDELTKRTGSSPDWLVSRALEAYAAHEAWQIEKIEAGIAAADRGDFATSEDVRRVRSKFAQTA